jgi:hypothetical protein
LHDTILSKTPLLQDQHRARAEIPNGGVVGVLAAAEPHLESLLFIALFSNLCKIMAQQRARVKL